MYMVIPEATQAIPVYAIGVLAGIRFIWYLIRN